MKSPIALTVALTGLASLAGCAAHEPASAGALPSPVIHDAGRNPRDRDITIITGAYFKSPSDTKDDVVASLNGRNWMAAKKIQSSSTTQYQVTIPYGPDYHQVWLRIYGMNREYSDPVLVHN